MCACRFITPCIKKMLILCKVHLQNRRWIICLPFPLELLFLFIYLFNSSVKLGNKRNWVVLCLLKRLIKQFFKFCRSCNQKHISFDSLKLRSKLFYLLLLANRICAERHHLIVSFGFFLASRWLCCPKSMGTWSWLALPVWWWSDIWPLKSAKPARSLKCRWAENNKCSFSP